MICHPLKTIFIHIPKTGGQSIERVLLDRLGLPREDPSLCLGDNIDLTRGPEKQAHMFASEYVKFGCINQSLFDKYLKFAVVRNPFDRLVSEYKFHLDKLGGISFREYLLEKWPTAGRRDLRRHIEPQVNFLLTEHSECWLVDHVFRFEQLQQELPRFFRDQLGFEAELPHINKSVDERPTREFYDEQTANFVRWFYAKDFHVFDFPLGVP